MRNCKSYTILILRFCFIILHSNLYSRICINFFLFTRFDDTSSDEDFESAAVARSVGKSTGDETTTRTNYMRKMTKMFKLLVKNMMRFPGLLVFCPLLEDMLVKITILYVTTLAPILLDLPVIWP